MARRKHKRSSSKSYKQPQVYDTSFKSWIDQQAEDILPLLVAGVEYEQTLTVEITRSMMRADKVFQVRYYGKRRILHIEFETGADDQLLSRLLVYNAALYHDYHLPVMTLVIYPFSVKMAVSPLVISDSDSDNDSEQEIIIFRFKTLPLFTLDAAMYVQQHRTCMYPLLPTMRGLHADMVTQVLNELSELYRDDEVTLAQQFVWMKLLLERTDVIPPSEKGKIKERLAMFDKLWEESPTVQKMREQYYEEGINRGMAQGINQGKVEAAQSMLVNAVQIKFPDLTEFAQKQVKLFNSSDTLELLFKKILTAPDAKSVRWLLESTPR